jgi:hypothetical protein
MWICVNSKQIMLFKRDITFCVMCGLQLPFLPEDDPKDRNWRIYLEAKKAAVPLTCAGPFQGPSRGRK